MNVKLVKSHDTSLFKSPKTPSGSDNYFTEQADPCVPCNPEDAARCLGNEW